MTMTGDSAENVAPSRAPTEEPQSGVTTEPRTEPEGAAAPEAGQQRESLIDAIADLLQMLVNWLRAEAADLVRDKLVLPIQQLGLTISSAAAAGCLAVIGLGFISVAILLVLAGWLGWPGALALVGGALLLGAGIFTFIKMRSIQK